MVLRDPGSGRFRRRGTFNNRFFAADNTLSQGIANFEFKMVDGMREVAEEFRTRIEEYARSNAPWEDRTGDARSGLTADVEQDGSTSLAVNLFHTVDYGIWLEIRWGGKYAILIPTIESMGPELLSSMKNMMDGITFYA